MNPIDQLNDEKVRELARTLRSSGLAASETEAVRMAQSMTRTNSKVNQNFEDRKDRNVMGLAHLHKQTPHTQPLQQAPQHQATHVQQHAHKVEEETETYILREEPKPAPTQQHHQTPTLQELQEDKDFAEEYVKQELVSSKPLGNFEKAEAAKPAAGGGAGAPVQAPVQPQEKPKPKKDISMYEESRVDLTKVFNSAK